MKFPPHSPCVRARVRFLAYHRIKPHVPPLVRAPVNSFEFHRCRRTPQVDYLMLSLRRSQVAPQTSSNHRLQCGLPGYLILFDPHTFVLQRQLHLSKLPSQLVFCAISKHFTATLHIPPTSDILKAHSIKGNSTVEPQYFTSDLCVRLRTL